MIYTLPTRRLISHGWDMPTPKLLSQADAADTPFDGTSIRCLPHAFDGTHWKRDDFKQSITDIQAAKPKRLTHNWIFQCVGTTYCDWFDEACFRQVIDHWAIAAWVAKETGCKGILFDAEGWTAEQRQWDYTKQTLSDKNTWDAYNARVRECGSRIASAVDGCHVFMLIGLSQLFNTPIWPAMEREMPIDWLGLIPAFVRGMMAGGANLTDGCQCAYSANSYETFAKFAAWTKMGATGFLDAGESNQIRVAMPLYLDGYLGIVPGYEIPGEGTTAEKLACNAKLARMFSDDYVWCYGEKYRWWPTDNTGVGKETWQEKFPGVVESLR